MIDLYAAIRAKLDAHPHVGTNESQRAAELNTWIDLAIDFIQADLDQHKPDYCGGQAEYEERDEKAFDKDGKHLGYITVRSDTPNPPDWCDTCSEHTPCRHVRDLAAKLGIYQWLGATDPEPPAGTLVVNESGVHWSRVPWLGPVGWLRADDEGTAVGDPEMWVTIARDHGPVRVVEATDA